MAEKIIALRERQLVTVHGDDAATFLQGIVTVDIPALRQDTASYCGLLTPQGKILFDFLIAAEPDGFLIDCAASQRSDLVKRLGIYKLRARVTISPDETRAVHVMLAPATGGLGDGRSPDMGRRLYAPAVEGASEQTSDYHARRVALGLGEGGHDFEPGQLFPHEANFDGLDAVSFTKGCFVGQEVVSRMEHRGTARSRIVPADVEGDAPPRDTPVEAGKTAIGRVLSAAGGKVLLLARLDRLMEAQGQPVTAAGRRLHPYRPGWAQFEMPASAREKA
jgi:folate-binding protein YgfZ